MLLCALVGTTALAAPPTWTPGKPVLKAAPHCTWGPPARLEDRLVVPKACRIPLGKKAVVRYSVEIRDITTGKRLGQASLPSAPATSDKPPQVGAILGGPYPLYVHAGGVAAVAVVARRMETVHEAEGTLVGLARHQELLAVVERVPAGNGAHATVWSLLDFGNGQELGTARLADGQLAAVGFDARGKALDATLQLRAAAAGGGVTGTLHTFRHALKTAKGLMTKVQPRFAPKSEASKAGPPATATACSAKPLATCPLLLDPALSVLPGATELRIGPAGCVRRPARSDTLMLAGPMVCAAALPPRGIDPGWAWLQQKVHGKDTWVLAPLTSTR